jgi:NDP-sugar pyrophosphorylase family protein
VTSAAARERAPVEAAQLPVTEALILAGGKAERLGDAAKGKPKPLVEVCGRPLMAYQIDRLRQAGVERVIVSCAVGKGKLFEEELAGLGTEIVPVEEPEPLGRGGGLRLAASARATRGPVFALNGDELLDLDLSTLLAHHRARGAAATITVVPLVSAFGIVDMSEEDMVGGFREAPRLPYWVNVGVYVLDDESLAAFPERGDHEQSAFPALAAAGRLAAFRHEGVWLTVNTPKQLRQAEDHLAAEGGWGS